MPKLPPQLTAAPNPIPPETKSTTLTWDTGDGSWGEVFLLVEGQQEKRFSEGPKGTLDVPWITAGAVYEFRLYAGKEHKQILATVKVSRK
jgi:hypothetical protein